MADADEDRPTLAGEAQEEELDEEVVDYRFIAAISGGAGKIPKRGEKDFEPQRTAHQTTVLESSREAMHAAISHPRVHIPKTHVIGIYEPDTGLTEIPKPSGVHFRAIGSFVRGRTRLLPEEALYFLERGTIDVRWPADEGQKVGVLRVEQEVTVNGQKMQSTYEKPYGLPMSLQAAYAVFLGMESDDLTLERYLVYANLKRTGYIVQRAQTWNCARIPGSDKSARQVAATENYWTAGFWRELFARFGAQARLTTGPLVTPGLYRSYADIYRFINIMPFHNPKITPPSADFVDPQTPFRVAFDVYKPAASFKKSSPGPPDFRIAVISARDHKGIPQLPELDTVFSHTPYNPPNDKAFLNQKLLHGYRNVILAVVDSGVISYLRLADAGFGLEQIYKRPPARGGKGRGRMRGGGRGRGGGK